MHLDRVPRIAKYLSVVMLFAYLGRSAVWFFLPVFFRNHIGSVFLIGLITSIPAAVPILLDIPISNLVQRSGEKIVIIMGLMAAILPGFMYITAIPAILVLGKVMEGLAKTMIWNGGWSLSLRSSDDDVEAETASIFLLGINLSIIIGPIFGGYIIQSQGFNPLFMIWIGTAAIGVILFYRYIGIATKKPFLESVETLFQRSTYMEEYMDLKSHSNDLRKPLALVFLYSLLLSFNWLVIPLLLDKMGASFIEMGIVFSIAGIPWLFQFLFADLSDKIGQLRVVSILAVLVAPILIYLGTVESIYVIAGGFILAKVLFSGFSPAIHGFFDSRVPEEIEGEMTGFLELVKHAGQTLGPFLAGTIASIWSLNASFIGAGVVAIMLFGLALIEF